MTGTTLIAPCAGRGSRFRRLGVVEPKPLIDLMGRPFFWWATESVLRVVPVDRMVFVVLNEHIRQFSITERIREFYADAEIVTLPDVTSGAAETARLGLGEAVGSEPIVINDCDHAFLRAGDALPSDHHSEEAAGSLMCFRSGNPAYSYASLDSQGQVSATVEKHVASPFAIAGCYTFASAKIFAEAYERYRHDCPYKELFVSGLYNVLLGQGLRVSLTELDKHLSFGTPEEHGAITAEAMEGFSAWRQA